MCLEIYNLRFGRYNYGHKIESDKMGWAHSTNGRDVYKIVVGISKQKRLTGSLGADGSIIF
jgi:hypothetical protein